MGRVLRYTIAGMLGALVAWAIVNPFICQAEYEAGPGRGAELGYWGTVGIGLVSGLFVGAMLGVADALGSASRRDATRSIVTCAVVGAIGGILGLHIGNVVYGVALSAAGGHAIYERPLPPGAPAASPLAFVFLVLGRGFGWALVGAAIGAAHGIAKRTPQKTINGAIGGFIGGGLGGSVFEILVWIGLTPGALPIPPSMMGSERSIYRFITYAITGGAIGLFIGFIEEFTKKAWLVRLVGRNEGKEILIYKPVTTLGRDEYADIPIFGDPDVAAKHATIAAVGQRHFIEDAGSTYGTRLNAAKITQREPLKDGDSLLIGKTRFMFRDKATARVGSSQPASQVQIPTSSHICEFCGAIKDANGNCDCTVGAQPAPDANQTVQQQMTQKVGGDSLLSTLNSQLSTSAKLIGMSGPYAGQTFVIDREMHIGRESTKDIALPMDNAVSRNHARIAIENGACVLYDDGSTNGTHVNNAKITRQQLAPSDMVQIGSTKFRFEGS